MLQYQFLAVHGLLTLATVLWNRVMDGLQVSSQRSPAVKREGSGATGGAGAQRPAIADSSTSSGEPSISHSSSQSMLYNHYSAGHHEAAS